MLGLARDALVAALNLWEVVNKILKRGVEMLGWL